MNKELEEINKSLTENQESIKKILKEINKTFQDLKMELETRNKLKEFWK